MTAGGPTWVLCGGATHADAPPDALRINIGPSDGHEIDVRIRGIEEQLLGRLPDRLHDLVCIAAFVLAADGAVRREARATVDDGKTWRRTYQFVIPVSDPEFWNTTGVRRQLSNLLDFLADDWSRFTFVQGTTPEGRQPVFLPAEGRSLIAEGAIDEVMLFSGGMDSFAGALQECVRDGRQVLLVSHRSSDRLYGIQRDLIKDLRERCKRKPPGHVSVHVRKRSEALRVEDTQRTRSLLFAALAGGVAWLSGLKRVRFYENGIIALNLPVSDEVLGARGTRTVHPKVIEDFGKLLTAVFGEPFTVDNPFEEKTRAEVAELIRDLGAADLLRHTWSCARVRHARKNEPFCGVCSQCIDRQFAVRAAGVAHEEPDSLYETRLFLDRLKTDNGVKMALSYVDAAREFRFSASDASFLAKFGAAGDAIGPLSRAWGCSYEDALGRVRELHRRQGMMVEEVMGRELKARALELGKERDPDTFLGRYLSQAETRDKVGDQDCDPATGATFDAQGAVHPGRILEENTFLNLGDGWLVGMKGRPGFFVKDIAGMHLICHLLRHPGKDFHALVIEKVAQGKEPPVSLPGSLPSMEPDEVARLMDQRDRLREEEEDLRSIGLEDRADELRAEREAVEDQLREGLKPDGTPRTAPPEAEEARSRVAKAIDRALQRIASKPGGVKLKTHLDLGIKRGFSLTYPHKGEALTWTTTS